VIAFLAGLGLGVVCAFSVGFVLGGVVGVIVAALAAAAGRGD
jgi:hypothetical protein